MEEWWISPAFCQSLEDTLQFLHQDIGPSSNIRNDNNENVNRFSRSSKFSNKTSRKYASIESSSSTTFQNISSPKSKYPTNISCSSSWKTLENLRTSYNNKCLADTRAMKVATKSSIADVYLEWEADITKTEAKTMNITSKLSISDAFLEWEADI